MKDYPDSFWATIYIAMALVVCTLALFAPTKENIVMAVIAIGSNIITGSFTYIQGKRAGERSVQVPLNPQTQVAVTQTPPEKEN